MNHNYSFIYKNVRISPLEKSNIESIRNWRNNPKNCAFLTKLPFITNEMQEKWFENYLINNDEMIFSIYENKDLNRLVGSLALYNFIDDTCEFGKILIGDDAAYGRKIGYNSIYTVLNIVNINTVYLHVY